MSKKGSAIVLTMIGAAVFALASLLIVSYMKTATQSNYIQYLKHEVAKAESGIRILLSQKNSWEKTTSISATATSLEHYQNIKIKHTVLAALKLNPDLTLMNNPTAIPPITPPYVSVLNPNCPSNNLLCGIEIKRKIDGTADIDMIASNIVRLTLTFTGRTVKAFDRVIEIEIPDLTPTTGTGLGSCPATKPILVGVTRDGSVICEELSNVFLKNLDAQKCKGTPFDGCYADNDTFTCPNGYFAKVFDFKVRCYRLPVVSCPAGEVIRTISFSDSAGTFLATPDCRPRPIVTDMLPPIPIPPPPSSESSSEEASASASVTSEEATSEAAISP